jgi:hypothetical protein
VWPLVARVRMGLLNLSSLVSFFTIGTNGPLPRAGPDITSPLPSRDNDRICGAARRRWSVCGFTQRRGSCRHWLPQARLRLAAFSCTARSLGHRRRRAADEPRCVLGELCLPTGFFEHERLADPGAYQKQAEWHRGDWKIAASGSTDVRTLAEVCELLHECADALVV